MICSCETTGLLAHCIAGTALLGGGQFGQLSHSLDSRCSYNRWWIDQPALFKPTSGQFCVMRQSRHAFSFPNEALSELLCGSLHPSVHDLRQLPIRLRWLSSVNRWQGARKHLAGSPSSVRSSHCHGWRPLPVALLYWLLGTSVPQNAC